VDAPRDVHQAKSRQAKAGPVKIPRTLVRPGRRRFLQISAAAAGLTALPAFARSLATPLHVQRDVLLGAESEIRLYHADRHAARAAIDACLAEVRRLEAIFSLEQPTSALSRLNAKGALPEPPADLVELFRIATEFSRATCGAFDVTVQPLWRLYADHFAQEAPDPDGPSPRQISTALAKIDYRQITIDENLVAFARPGMCATLNGIAQGFITDRAAEILRLRGFEHVLVNMGEMRALAGHPGGAPWRIGIADPQHPWRTVQHVDLLDRALATSGGYGTAFDAGGRHHHLFDPRTGRSALHFRSVSVLAPTATMADALSTGLSIVALEEVPRILAGYRNVNAILLAANGAMHAL
jgi:thiamine biosynthesis lipoprotein